MIDFATKTTSLKSDLSPLFPSHFFPLTCNTSIILKMAIPCASYLRINMLLITFIVTLKPNFGLSGSISSLKTLPLDGHLEFEDILFASKDFGNRYHRKPQVVLHPKSVADIATTVKHIWEMGPVSDLTVAARGHGHSLQGQAQAEQGVVINMESLGGRNMKVHSGEFPYIDVSGGELWINVLHESQKYGLTPKSWTDYLHLTVGGTLSNAGISGQAFRHGPQISNVIQLEVVTGTGEVVNCSETQNNDLFYAVLGGLGQFGIITRARISLEPTPDKVKWIRVLYLDFPTFKRDQEHLISGENTFDYIEGFVIINQTGLLNNWRSSFNPEDPVLASQFKSDGRTLYCLELVKYFNLDEADEINKEVEGALSQLSYIRSTQFLSEVSYASFLDRVHVSEIKLRSKGLWEVPHPWLNLLIPGSKIQNFAEVVFNSILRHNINGPILIYPMHRSKWDKRSSVVIPEEDIFYLVAFLSSAVPSSEENDGLEHILSQNKKVLEFCEASHLGVKQYLPHYTTREEWQAHFGSRWEVFVKRKLTYDPLAILAPGQSIFHKGTAYL